MGSQLLFKKNFYTLILQPQDFSVKAACQNGVSNLSDLLSVSVIYELNTAPNAPKCIDLIIKLLPHDPFSRYFVTEAQFDLREIKFYTKVPNRKFQKLY